MRKTSIKSFLIFLKKLAYKYFLNEPNVILILRPNKKAMGIKTAFGWIVKGTDK
jgi:hypothetical protein